MSSDDVRWAGARRGGATNFRFIPESANSIAISLIERGFFRKIGSFALFRAKAETVPEKRQFGLDTPQLATQADIDDIINTFKIPKIFPAMGGLIFHLSTAYEITGV